MMVRSCDEMRGRKLHEKNFDSRGHTVGIGRRKYGKT